ncbi:MULTISPECIES: hypothetical protein [Mesorhizobium]|uniref:hypothetical protein n=1 Tax=Mesorhizobium TaxID=68287 RepID=UPI0003CE669A|nr:MULTISPECIES: hypothetical protein [Mesorhizobium]ESY70016.1 hypothetical protein X742_05765 [Mesorhizobium sp. LNHC232B00]WJI40303.1 hypothetical protein NL534_08700 [Mesorhizobium opportunistum]
MPNTHVPAAGEAMPAANVSRRLLLAGIASIPAIAGATAAPTAPDLSPITRSLQVALLDYQSAEDHYSACEVREAAIAEALGEKLFPEWKAPGGIRSRWSHIPMVFRTSKALEAEIKRKRDQIEKSFAGGMMNRSAYDGWMRDIEAQGTEGVASLREGEAVIEASGHPEAYRQTDEAFSTAKEAFGVVLRHPCQSIEDVRAKASSLLRGNKRLSTEFDEGELVACLSSLCEVQ